MDSAPKGISSHERAAALIIVLAFVVLLTGLVLAYFSRATSDRPVAQSSFHQSKVDQVAVSGVGLIIGDLRPEIGNGFAGAGPPFWPTPTPGSNHFLLPNPHPTPRQTNPLPTRTP